MSKKKILFVMHRPPHGGIVVQETLDVILTAAAFDQDVSLLFLDDGVFQLTKGQRPAAAGLKDIAPVFLALPIYDVRRFFAEQESLGERGLEVDRLVLPVTPVRRADLSFLLRQHDVILNG